MAEMPNYCPKCGNPMQFQDTDKCPYCGTPFQSQSPPQPQRQELRNPWLALILSFLVVGWGQWYNGRTWDGIKLLGTAIGAYVIMTLAAALGSGILLGLIVLIVICAMTVIWVYGMYNAYKTAERINKGEITFTRKSRLFWLPVAIFVLAIVVILAAVIAAFIFGMAGNIQTR